MNKLIELNNIKSIDILFENCECIKVPVECFKEFNIEIDNTIEKEEIDNFNANLKSLKCKIIDKGNIYYLKTYKNNTTSPLSRIINYNDITAIYLYDYEDNRIELRTPWDGDCNNNYNQHLKVLSHKEIELHIAENSKEYILEEALDELKDGYIIIDANGNEYEICENNITGEKYLNTILKQSLLKEVFTKKDEINNATSYTEE